MVSSVKYIADDVNMTANREVRNAFIEALHHAARIDRQNIEVALPTQSELCGIKFKDDRRRLETRAELPELSSESLYFKEKSLSKVELLAQQVVVGFSVVSNVDGKIIHTLSVLILI